MIESTSVPHPKSRMSLPFRLFQVLVRSVGGRGLGLHRIPLVSRAYESLSSKLVQGVTVAKVDGQKLYVKADASHIANSLITMGVWEKRETEVFLSLIKPHMTILDVGAHVGYYTLLAAKRVAQVYAFEPDPETFGLLSRSVNANGHTNVKCFHAAVTNKMGRANFHVDSEAWGNSLCSENVSNQVRQLEVETLGLDELFASGALGERVDLLKIDVQGAEELVLNGAERILAECQPIILMEVEPHRLRNMGTDPVDLLKCLECKYGYELRAIEDTTQSHSVDDIIALAERDLVINVIATPPTRRINQ
ncbi:MAG: FkbM family methyltransferase [bacterium]